MKLWNKLFGGVKALFSAIEDGDLDTCRRIIERRGNLVNAKPDCVELEWRVYYGQTPLHMAAYSGQSEIVEFLIEKGADIHSRNGDNGSSPLHMAFRFPEVATILIARGAEINARDDHGHTPLHGAAYYCQVDVVKELLNAGADTQATDNLGRTPLDVVVIALDGVSAVLDGVDEDERDAKRDEVLALLRQR